MHIRGTSGIDNLFGTALSDIMEGFQGDDSFWGSAGGDAIYGGDDVATALGDTVIYADSHAAVKIDLRYIDQQGGTADGDRLYSIENIVGSKYNDTIRGTQGTRLMEGGAGADAIAGEFGFHNTAGYAGSTSGVRINLNFTAQRGGDAEGDQLININDVVGSRFADFLVGNTNSNQLSGGANNDTFQGGFGNDRLDGGDGVDTLNMEVFDNAGGDVYLDGIGPSNVGMADYSGSHQDTLISIENVNGTQYADDILGSAVDNEVRSGGGTDDVFGNGGSDTLYGGAGNDALSGDAGRDFLYGEDDNDTLTGGSGADHLAGGNGYDTAVYYNSTRAVTVTLGAGNTGVGSGRFGDAQDDTLVGIEHLNGSDYDDRLTGNELSNTLNGGSGNDELRGGSGRDTLIGDKGNDTLFGGGDDGYRDEFVFSFVGEGSGNGNDRIADWESVDVLVIQNAPANMEAHVAQVGGDVVITIDGMSGSITVLHSQASEFDFLL